MLVWFLSVLWRQATKAQIVHHILDFLHLVLDDITALAQDVVLQVQNLEASMDVLDEPTDLMRAVVITQSDGIACQPRKFIQERDEGK